LISEDIAEWSGANLAGLPQHPVYTRAGQEPTMAYAVDDPLKLGEVLLKQAGRLGRKPARRRPPAKRKKPTAAASPETTIPEPPKENGSDTTTEAKAETPPAAKPPSKAPPGAKANGAAQAEPTPRVAS
jgi:hypothetical protein